MKPFVSHLLMYLFLQQGTLLTPPGNVFLGWHRWQGCPLEILLRSKLREIFAHEKTISRFQGSETCFQGKVPRGDAELCCVWVSDTIISMSRCLFLLLPTQINLDR